MLLAFAWCLVVLLAATAFGLWLFGKAYTRNFEARYPREGEIVIVDGLAIHYRRFGDPGGPPVLFIHGAASSSTDVGLAMGNAALRHGICLYVPDRPGLGHSQAFTRVANRLARHGELMAGFILALRLIRPVVIGHSYGGSIALKMALDHCDQIGAVIPVAAPATPHVGPASWYNYVSDWPVIGAVLRLFVPVIGPSMIEPAMIKTFAPQTEPDDYVARSGVLGLFRPSAFRENAADLARINRELEAIKPRYSQITLPMAIIASPDDQVVYTERHSGPLSQEARDTRLVMVCGGGHMPHYLDPDVIAEHARALAATV
jgi:pimeloyl-ACP methyl ester carboxylesterase